MKPLVLLVAAGLVVAGLINWAAAPALPSFDTRRWARIPVTHAMLRWAETIPRN